MGSHYIKIGLGLNWHVIKTKHGFKEINKVMIDDTYQEKKKRFIMIDQEGVIPMKNANGKLEPSNEAIRMLNRLSDNPLNAVFLISSESKRQMHQWYHNKCPKLGLAAENGFFWRWMSQGLSETQWHQLI